MRPTTRIAAAAAITLTAATLTGVAQAQAAPVATAKGAPAVAAVAAAEKHPGTTGFGADQSLRAVGTMRDTDGTTHVRLHRTFHGLPVLGGDLVVHRSASGSWQDASGKVRSPLKLGVSPSVGKAAAQSEALAPNAVTKKISGAKAERSRLVVDAVAGAPRLAWEVMSGGKQKDGTPSRLATYVDAKSGKVIRQEQQIETVDGDGQSLYLGTVPLNLTQNGSSYELKDAAHGGTYTTDMSNKEDSILCQILGVGCQTGTLFTSPDTHFGDGTNGNRESAAVDAQYGSNATWDFYKSTYGRDGIFGNGKGSYNRVHYGNGYVNAFWDGEKMTYGDGDGTDYGPLVSLDVTGHEMSHGVTENTAALAYSGESGGLNESTSDIFGTMVEFFANDAKDPGDYLIGEQFDLTKHLGFRRMDQPSKADDSLDCWSSDAKNVDVHYSSGIGNHFFYLLSEGSGAKTINGVSYDSPTCDGSTVSGIGRDAAAKIWYRALTTYFTSSTDYKAARTATLSAAKDLYGDGSTQYDAVAAAWSAVSVS